MNLKKTKVVIYNNVTYPKDAYLAMVKLGKIPDLHGIKKAQSADLKKKVDDKAAKAEAKKAEAKAKSETT